MNACKKREFFEKKIQKNEKIVVRASDTSCFLQEHLKEIPYISKKNPKGMSDRTLKGTCRINIWEIIGIL